MKAGRKPITAQTKKGQEKLRSLDSLAVAVIADALRDDTLSMRDRLLAAQYVYDHNHGRPKARIEAEVEQKIDADKLLALKRRMLEIEHEETVKLAQYSIIGGTEDERNNFRRG